MDWNAERYESWFATPEGRFALAAERRLLDSVVAEWPRRNQRLLEIGCGTGLFQQLLDDDGFTVAGLDKSPAMIEGARKRLGPAAELYVGNGEALPFADNEYDFCVLWTVLEFCDNPGQVLAEAARVASKGLVIGFFEPPLRLLAASRRPLALEPRKPTGPRPLVHLAGNARPGSHQHRHEAHPYARHAAWAALHLGRQRTLGHAEHADFAAAPGGCLRHAH